MHPGPESLSPSCTWITLQSGKVSCLSVCNQIDFCTAIVVQTYSLKHLGWVLGVESALNTPRQDITEKRDSVRKWAQSSEEWGSRSERKPPSLSKAKGSVTMFVLEAGGINIWLTESYIQEYFHLWSSPKFTELWNLKEPWVKCNDL